jgi:NarL family two-component system sensor histidine kinase LiaS
MANAERIRLAQQLHDGIAQDLVGLGYSLDLLLAAPLTPVDTRIQLRTLRFTITDMVEKVRQEMFQLRQPTLSQQIHHEAISICQDLTLSLVITEVSLSADSEPAYELLRIYTELLRNVTTHSQATSVAISLSENNGVITLEISDDGRGGARVTKSRYGLAGIHERAEHIGANFAIVSDASGTHASLRYVVR